MAEPLIQQFRVSFVWVRAFPDLVNGSKPDAPMAFLGNKTEFAARFDAVQRELAAYVKKWEAENAALIENAKYDPFARTKLFVERVKAYRAYTNDPLHLTPLWDWMQPNYVHHFWDRYLQMKENPLAEVTGTQAWDALVPLRVVPAFQIRAPWLNGGIIVDGLLYPHAVGLAFMVNLSDKKMGMRFTDLMETLLKVRENETFEVTMSDGTVTDLTLDRLANRILSDLLARVFGADTPETIALDGPLSVGTFVHVLNVNPQSTLEEKSFAHRLLHGICTWDPAWSSAPDESFVSIPIADLTHPGKLKKKEHVIFHSPRGRAVWFPTWFIRPPGRGNHKLSCYHRNLTLSMLQTEALALGAQLAYPDIIARKKPVDALAAFALNAAKRAHVLYLRRAPAPYLAEKKVYPTYRSGSPKAQLDENLLDDVKLMDIVIRVRDGLSAP